MQTLFKRSWNGAKVVYAGHNGVDRNGQDVNKTHGWGQYEHLQPKDWPIDPDEPGMNEMYRVSCTSLAWVGEALAARIMHAEKCWDHDAFFAYVDRWMTQDDAESVKIIKEQTKFAPYPATGLNLSLQWERQRQTSGIRSWRRCGRSTVTTFRPDRTARRRRRRNQPGNRSLNRSRLDD